MQSTLAERLRALDLPLDQIIIAGSGLLDVLGIRRADDIDAIASGEVFERLSSEGDWSPYTVGQDRAIGRPGLEVWETWYGKSYDQAHEETVVIDGVRYMNHRQTVEWKCQLGRPKDITDIALLEEYYSHHG